MLYNKLFQYVELYSLSFFSLCTQHYTLYGLITEKTFLQKNLSNICKKKLTALLRKILWRNASKLCFYVDCNDRGGHNATSRMACNDNIQVLYMYSSLITNRVLEAFQQTRD